MNAHTPLYPLIFEPIYKEKVWGGRALSKLGRDLPGDESVGIGESWEIADLATTSASGGGGSAEHSVVANGPLVGKSLRALMQTYGQALLGHGVKPADDGGFPLLIKFLDAKENLSVQVHPSPQYAAAHPDAHLKSEAWYVVDCEPGAVIYKGLVPGTTSAQLRAAIEANTDAAVVPLLNALPAKKGDCHYLPSGTLHALGAGVLVAEVQTPSDTTFRVYDWGRTDRELHIDQAMACIDFGVSHPVDESLPSHSPSLGLEIRPKASCDFFEVDEVHCENRADISVAYQSARIVVMLEGVCRLTHLPTNDKTDLKPGQSVLFPAESHDWALSGDAGRHYLIVKLPDPAR